MSHPPEQTRPDDPAAAGRRSDGRGHGSRIAERHGAGLGQPAAVVRAQRTVGAHFDLGRTAALGSENQKKKFGRGVRLSGD